METSAWDLPHSQLYKSNLGLIFLKLNPQLGQWLIFGIYPKKQLSSRIKSKVSGSVLYSNFFFMVQIY